MPRGCFPATPASSPSISRHWASAPVWLDLSLVEFAKTLQYRGKGEPSDFVVASTLIANHERVDADRAKAAGLAVRSVSVKQCAQYLSAAFKAKGALDMQLQHDTRCAAHPADAPGHIISACPICAQGADPAKLGVPTEHQAEAGSEATRGDGFVHPVEVRNKCDDCVLVCLLYSLIKADTPHAHEDTEQVCVGHQHVRSANMHASLATCR